ncbi:hypothetical protein Tco_0665646 [Tanacetum coccineum]
MHREIRYKDITRQSFQQRFIRKLITTTNTMALLVRIGVVVVLVEGIVVGFAVDFGISCLAFVVDIVVVEIVEIAEVARESKGNRIGVSYQTREGVRGFYKENELGLIEQVALFGWTLTRDEPTEDKARELWVELKRLFEPDDNDTLWKLQRYMHDPLNWWLYDTCGVHHVSTKRGHDIYMLVEKDYPLTKALMTLMLYNKLRVDQYSNIAEEPLKKIFILVERPRQ